MASECSAYFSQAACIFVDLDFPPTGGLGLVQALADFPPVCPVLLQAANPARVRDALAELELAGWEVESSIHEELAAQLARFRSSGKNTHIQELPRNHAARVRRARLSLDGLGLGDALGEMLSYRFATAPDRLLKVDLPPAPWIHTDDTEMAISLTAVLKAHGYVHQEALVRRFARRFQRDSDRGYGKMTRMQMRQIAAGSDWREVSEGAFGGSGSMGNGSAMRVAPLGAFFADDLPSCVAEARNSSMVTHSHPEGVAGAVAIAVAAAMAWRLRKLSTRRFPAAFFEGVLEHTPESLVKTGVLRATQLVGAHPSQAAAELGNGFQVTAPDTVPFCLWVAAHNSRNFVEALSQTIAVGGDCDTNAAIVGGIVALSAGRRSIPDAWLESRERFLL